MGILEIFVLGASDVNLPADVVFWRGVASYLVIAGALVLWFTCIFFGVIARRYELVLRKSTRWQFMMIAPSGILVYAILKLYSSVILQQLKMPYDLSLVANGLFLISGMLSLVAALQFYNVVAPRKRR